MPLILSEYGPIFGGGWDIKIVSYSYSNTNTNNYSNLGYYYKHPHGVSKTSEADSFFAGSFQFQLNEIEVYQKIKKKQFFEISILLNF